MGHLRDVQAHEGHVQHVGRSKAVPGVHHAVLPPADGDAHRLHLLHARQATAFRVGVVAALQGDVDQRVRDRGHAAFGDQRQQLRHIVVVHRMHRGQMTARRAARQAHAASPRAPWFPRGATSDRRSRRSGRPTSGPARPRCGQGRASVSAPSSIVRSKCGMPPTTSTPMSSARSRFCRPGLRPVKPVLRERHQLQVKVGGDPPLHLQHRFDPAQVVGRGVDMSADRQETHADSPVAVGDGAVDHFVHRGDVAQLPPQRDAFQERARGVYPRQAVGQRRVHVEMRVDEGRRDKVPGRVDHLGRLRLQPAHGGNPVAGDADIGHRSVGQRAALDQQIEHLSVPPCCRAPSAPLAPRPDGT